MTRFSTTTAALAAFIALGSVAANATDLRIDGTLNPGASVAATSHGKDAVRAGNVYTPRELMVAGLNETDIVEFPSRDRVAVRAGDVHSPLELIAAGLDANDVLTVSNFGGNGQGQTRGNPGSLRFDR